MPRSSKKKQKKAEDFKKVKLKLGKKKAPASNSTDTSFTSRAIVVSEQSISADKSAQLTDSRNHTLKELLAQLRHHSAPARKDAVNGVGDFAVQHPQALRAELGAVVSAAVRLVVDDEPSVRRQLLRLFRVLLPAIDARELAPFVPLAVIFTCSAMTHILDDIRGDAVKFLELLADAAPESVAQFAPRVLPSFFSLLDTTSTTSGDGVEANARTALLTQGRRLDILRSCHKFLCVFTRPRGLASDMLAFMASARAAPATRAEQLFCPDAIAPFAELGLFGETERADTSNSADASAMVRTQSAAALERLFPFLQATWIESAAMFAGGNFAGDQSLQLCSLVMQTLQVLWRAAYGGAVPRTTRLAGFLRQCTTFFPFGREYSGGDPGVEDELLALNVRVCELAALVRLGGNSDSKGSSDDARVVRRATRYVLQTLGDAKGREARLVRHEQFGELLSVAWRLMRSGGSDAEQILASVMHYTKMCPLASPSKTLGIRFITRIIDAQWARMRDPDALSIGGEQLGSLAAAWVQQLPKLLWQLRDRNLEASLAAARALRVVCQRTRMLDAGALETLRASLATLFSVSVPGKGRVHGPFRVYPPELQQAVLEIVACCPHEPRLARAVRASIADCHEQVCVLAREIIA
ncbi:rRNA processing protein [Coemansia erecta]|nr:rRNA processing protein [Coemansia sp. RSA 2618]KAJ2827543.1 rRNA processing protein [Coemansia erecta]